MFREHQADIVLFSDTQVSPVLYRNHAFAFNWSSQTKFDLRFLVNMWLGSRFMLVWFWAVTKMTRLRSQRVFSCTQKTALASATPYNLILRRGDFHLFGCKLVDLMVLCRSGGISLSLLPSHFGIFPAPQKKLHWPLLGSFFNLAIWLLKSL